MLENKNLYGDTLVALDGCHGTDIAVQRIDELDRECLRYIVGLDCMCTAVDLGCGSGSFGIRLAALGCNVYLYDLIDITAQIASISEIPVFKGAMRFVHGDLREFGSLEKPKQVHVLYSQRTLHYFRFFQATEILEIAYSMIESNGKLFISASGLYSELGHGYNAVSIEERFEKLSSEMQQKHHITSPLCLYTEAELVQLCESAGFKTEKIWSSPFGNIKGIFVR